MWSKPDENYLAAVKAALDAIGQVCPRCLLRLSGIKNSREHKNAEGIPEETQHETNGSEPPEKKMRLMPLPCRACLGVLQEGFMQPALEKLCEDIRSAGYDADHFTIAISLPVSLALRNHSLNLYLQEKVPEFNSEHVTPIKQIWKWLFPQRIESAVGKRHVSGEHCEFYAELQFDFVDDEKELGALQKMCAEEYKMRAKKHRKYHMGLVTRQGADKSLADVSAKQFRANYTVPPEIPLQGVDGKSKMYHNSIFLAGRYNKYSRELPQTPWLVDGVRKMETSVEELISERIKLGFKFDSARFCSSGREDVDVRTLGIGRPFLFEIINPRKVHFSPEELLKLEEEVNCSTDKIKVRRLAIIEKNYVKLIKEGEDQKRKTYNALCIAPTSPFVTTDQLKKLGTIKDLELLQRTPIRVLHRRPNATRPRTIYSMNAEPLTKERLTHFEGFDHDSDSNVHKLFCLSLTTQAGTYVKEFIHGDFGRTNPNLREILGIPDLDIIALDVESIDLEWPPNYSTKNGSPTNAL